MYCSNCNIIYKYDSQTTGNTHLNNHLYKCGGQAKMSDFFKKSIEKIRKEDNRVFKIGKKGRKKSGTLFLIPDICLI